MEEEVISIGNIVYVLKKKWRLIAVITLLSTVIASAITFLLIKPQYESSTKVFIGKEENTSSEYDNNDIQMYQKLMKTYAELVKTDDLVKSALDKLEINTTVEVVLGGITATSSADTQILQITYRGIEPKEVFDVLKVIVEEFMVKAKELIPNGNVQIISEAKFPLNPISPNKYMNIAIGFLLGLMSSIGLVFLLEYIDNTFKTKDQLEQVIDIPVIGVIPRIEKSSKVEKI